MKVACAGCREAFESADLKDVGTHLFCATCFDNLLKPAPVPEPTPIQLTFERTPDEETTDVADSELCFVCQVHMPDGPHTSLGGLGVCLLYHFGSRANRCRCRNAANATHCHTIEYHARMSLPLVWPNE